MNTLAVLGYGFTVALGFVYFGGCVWATHYRAKTKTGINDDQKAKELFLELVSAAEKKIAIYNDGNAADGSIYEDPDVVNTLEKRLLELQSLEVKCLFNKPDDTLFSRTFKDHERVAFRTASERSDVHFRIADDGKMGWISWHEEGEGHRPFEMHDFRNVPAFFGAGFMKRSTFGAHIEKMERHFA